MKAVSEFTKVSVNKSFREMDVYLSQLKASDKLMFRVEDGLQGD